MRASAARGETINPRPAHEHATREAAETWSTPRYTGMKIRRHQPPVGYRFPIGRLAAAVRDAFAASDANARFERELAGFLGLRSAFAVSSGKAALTIILRALARGSDRRKVIVPAYTCHSVPSAVVRAGLDLVPCDTAVDSFDFNYDRLRPVLRRDVLCVVSIHLFGIPADTRRLKDFCQPEGIVVVEDAAQALGGRAEAGPLGSTGDVAFFSLGRGKNITCGSGGVIATNSEPVARAIAGEIRQGASNGVADLRTAITLLMMSLFISPYAYWFPVGLPFLKLGETIYDTTFPVRTLSNFQSLLLRGWQTDLAELNAIRRRNGNFYLQHVNGVRPYVTDVPYLRFPVLLPTEEIRTRLLRDWNGAAFGISPMYPRPIHRIEELKGIAGGPFPQAERLARGLITLPTHPLVSTADKIRICNLVNDALQERMPPTPAS